MNYLIAYLLIGFITMSYIIFKEPKNSWTRPLPPIGFNEDTFLLIIGLFVWPMILIAKLLKF